MSEDKLQIDDMSMQDLLQGVPESVRSGTIVQAKVLAKSADGVLVDVGDAKFLVVGRPHADKAELADGCVGFKVVWVHKALL